MSDRPDETFKVDSETSARIRRLAKDMECGLRDVIRFAVLELEAQLSSQRDFEARMGLRLVDTTVYTAPREFAGDDEAPF